MYKNIKIANIGFTPDGNITINEILNKEFLPLHILYQLENINNSMAYWLNHRLIPQGRDNLDSFLKVLNIPSRFALSMKSHSASLSDVYWLKKESESITWKDINFFDNQYDYDIGNIIMGFKKPDIISYFSPDNTTNGQMKKVWRKISKKDYLYKAGLAPNFQEPMNEVFSSKVAEKFEGLDFVQYFLTKVGSNLCSVCENFVSQEEEFIPAFSIYQIKENYNNSIYDHLLDCCNELNIKNVPDFLDKMIAFDYLIANSDRHMGNFGFMRNTKTLEFTRPAPLFDNGTSLWVNDIFSHIETIEDYGKPFCDKQSKQLQLVKNLDFIQIMELKQLDDYLSELCKSNNMDSKRRDIVCKNFQKKVQDLYSKREQLLHKNFIYINLKEKEYSR